MKLKPGTLVNNRYTIKSCIGEGGFGITYLAQDEHLMHDIVLKEFFPKFMVRRDIKMSNEAELLSGSNEQAYETGKNRFLNEARTLATLQTIPEIVTIFDHFQENNTAYIVMEYIEGKSLREIIGSRTTPFTFDEAMSIMKPCMEALSKVHEKGMIHRDFTPDNILMTTDGRIKVIDFGSSRDFANGEKTMTVMVKHGFAPLEQYSNDGKQGTWTDVYSICAILYIMTTLKKPVSAIDRIMSDTLVPPRSINPGLSVQQEQVILRGLAVSYADRYQTIFELLRAIYPMGYTAPVYSAPYTNQSQVKTVLIDQNGATKGPAESQMRQSTGAYTGVPTGMNMGQTTGSYTNVPTGMNMGQTTGAYTNIPTGMNVGQTTDGYTAAPTGMNAGQTTGPYTKVPDGNQYTGEPAPQVTPQVSNMGYQQPSVPVNNQPYMQNNYANNAYAQQPQKSKTGLIIGISCGVVAAIAIILIAALGGGSHKPDPEVASTHYTPAPTREPSPEPSSEPVSDSSLDSGKGQIHHIGQDDLDADEISSIAEDTITNAPSENVDYSLYNGRQCYYFEEYGYEIDQRMPSGLTDVPYLRMIQGDETMYQCCDDGIAYFSCTRKPYGNDLPGYDIVTFVMDMEMHQYYDSYTGLLYEGLSTDPVFYDYYTGRNFYSYSDYDDENDLYIYTLDLDSGDETIVFFLSGDWNYGEYRYSGDDQVCDACLTLTANFIVPEGYDGLTFGMWGESFPNDNTPGSRALEVTNAADSLDNVYFFRFGN